MTWQTLDTAPRDGRLVKLQVARDPDKTVKARWIDDQWRHQNKSGVNIRTNDNSYTAWSEA